LVEVEQRLAGLQQGFCNGRDGAEYGGNLIGEVFGKLKIVRSEIFERGFTGLLRLVAVLSAGSSGTSSETIAAAISSSCLVLTRGCIPGIGMPLSCRTAICRIRHCQPRK